VAWDRARYRSDVLDPARRAGNVPPADLYVRYGLAPGRTDATAFSEQVREVVGYWRELKSSRTLARLAENLLAAHAELERAGQLTPQGFAERLAQGRRENIGRLNRLAETEAGAATYVGPTTVARLRDTVGGGVSDAEVTEALRRAGVKVVRQFPALPATPHPKQGDLDKQLTALNRWLSAEVVFGDAVARGFRVLDGFTLADGRILDDRAISQARTRVQARPFSDPGRVPSENVLALLGSAARQPGDLNTLLLAEVTERLRKFARSGFVQKGIASQAAELGLEYEEAGLLAAAIMAPDTRDQLRQQVTNKLSAGELRQARRLGGELPPGDPLLDRIAGQETEVATLIRRADRELARDQSEVAAQLLAEALAIARDDTDLSGRLAALPPPSPHAPVIQLNGNHVSLAWEPGPALAGQIHYRVMRGEGLVSRSPGEGTPVVTRTVQCFVTDLEAPPGAELFYSIFAGRGGQAWSPPAVTPPVRFTPDVTDLVLEADATSVTASWQVHPAAEGVEVTRRLARPPTGPQDGTAVPALPSGFTDAGLRTGAEYYYRITVRYRSPDGQHRHSAGLVTRAVPEPVPQAVTDLEASASGDQDPVIVARWTPPDHGQVRLALFGQPPPWPAGTALRPGEAAGLHAVPGVTRTDPDGRHSQRLRPPPGRQYLVAVTVGRNAAVAGHAVEVRLAEPVRDLCAVRLHDEVRLSWIWPDDAIDALVLWAGREQSCSRRSYRDDGGMMIAVGPGETAVEVRARFQQPGGLLAAPGIIEHVPGRPVAVSYRIHRTGRLHPRRRLIELSAERAADLPALVVVESDGAYAPDHPDQGEPVQRIKPQPITPDHPVTIEAEATHRPVWLACFADPVVSGEQPQQVLLFPPPAEEMRVR
jgi:hypothetical protein